MHLLISPCVFTSHVFGGQGEQLLGSFPYTRSWVLNSAGHAWQQAPLLTEPSCCPASFFLDCLFSSLSLTLLITPHAGHEYYYF